MRAKRRDSTCSSRSTCVSHDGSVSPTHSLRSSSSGVTLSPPPGDTTAPALPVQYNIRRSTSRTSGVFLDTDDEEVEFETKPIPRESYSYTVRRSFRRSGRRRSDGGTGVSATLGALSVNSPLSESLSDIPAVDEDVEGEDAVCGGGVALASPDCSLDASLLNTSRALDTIEEANSPTSGVADDSTATNTPAGSGSVVSPPPTSALSRSAARKRKSSTDLSVVSEPQKSKRRSLPSRKNTAENGKS